MERVAEAQIVFYHAIVTIFELRRAGVSFALYAPAFSCDLEQKNTLYKWAFGAAS
ncbi:hypothetical protein MUN84_03770 [Hymenobacter sp. 5516J-16]|uniref:hypothetical protein n=1 Tax=Hymenobacter sp. 5516J-16 TaxID=2932253 RepID=UPI001FD2ED01|nr:hypothetical protein [Hymenobacter sp. 5516J-16]UOQ77791.1 hypothetical protein MUN84_03770 [Hymenobacter sp. 5516J-16]